MHIPHECGEEGFDKEKHGCTPCIWHDLTLTVSRITGLMFQAHMEFDVATGFTYPDEETSEEERATRRLEAAKDIAESFSQIMHGATLLLHDMPPFCENVLNYLTEEQQEVFTTNIRMVRTSIMKEPEQDDEKKEAEPSSLSGLSFGYH